MKPFLSSILLIAFCIPNVGTSLFLKALKGMIKQEVKFHIESGLNQDDLTTFTFSPQESDALEWEHEKEFSYQGMMYDVVKKVKLADGNWEYWVYADHKESQIKKTIHMAVDQQMNHHPDKNAAEGHLISFMQNLFSSSLNHSFLESFERSMPCFLYEQSALEATQSDLTPPPESRFS